jgi:hypothetical protein
MRYGDDPALQLNVVAAVGMFDPDYSTLGVKLKEQLTTRIARVADVLVTRSDLLSVE